MLPIKGIEKTSLVDFPPYTASTIFIGGCNWRCPFCHNPELVFSSSEVNLPEEKVLEFLESRKKWIDGICITGGEPTLYPDLVPFVEKVKALGLLVKLDTNGTNPEMLVLLTERGLLDYIAMDIKNTEDKYEQTIGVAADMDKLKRSIEIIRSCGIDYEFRTTVVPGIHSKKDIQNIGNWLSGSKKYSLQQFRSSKPLVDQTLQGKPGYKTAELEELRDSLKCFFNEVELRK